MGQIALPALLFFIFCLSGVLGQHPVCRRRLGVVRPGFRLNPGNCIVSANGTFQLLMLPDNNLALFRSIGRTCGSVRQPALWTSMTYDLGNYGRGYAMFERNGNLSVFKKSYPSPIFQRAWTTYLKRGADVPACLHIDDTLGAISIYGNRLLWRIKAADYRAMTVPGYCAHYRRHVLPKGVILKDCILSPDNKTQLQRHPTNFIGIWKTNPANPGRCNIHSRQNGAPLWRTPTYRSDDYVVHPILLASGNFQIYSTTDITYPMVWETGTAGNPQAACLAVLNTGNLVILAQSGRMIWASGVSW